MVIYRSSWCKLKPSAVFTNGFTTYSAINIFRAKPMQKFRLILNLIHAGILFVLIIPVFLIVSDNDQSFSQIM